MIFDPMMALTEQYFAMRLALLVEMPINLNPLTNLQCTLPSGQTINNNFTVIAFLGCCLARWEVLDKLIYFGSSRSQRHRKATTPQQSNTLWSHNQWHIGQAACVQIQWVPALADCYFQSTYIHVCTFKNVNRRETTSRSSERSYSQRLRPLNVMSACNPISIIDYRYTLVSRNSSVGRALDWRSKGPWFNPGFRHGTQSGGWHDFCLFVVVQILLFFLN